MKNEEIIEAVQRSTAEVFSTMLGLEIVPGPIETAQKCPPTNEGVMSFIGLSGPWVGSGVFSCSPALACRLCEALLMTESTSVNEEVLDAVGELANMIIGNFKTVAEAVVGALALSLPTVIYGRNFTSKSIGSTGWLVMPFSCGDERFEVRVWFRPASESGSVRQAISTSSTSADPSPSSTSPAPAQQQFCYHCGAVAR